MKNTILRNLSLSAALLSPLAFGMGCAENGRVGTSREISHSESDKKGWFGGNTHQADTAYKNSDGSTSIEKETTTVKGDTTTITRVRTTTNVDGKVNTDRETRTMVKGTDNVVHESTTNN
jgi:hypothetical protein